MSTYYEVGKYACQIDSNTLGASQKGTPQLIIRFTVRGLIDRDGELNPVSREYQRTAYRAITDKTIPYLIEDLKALSLRISSFEELDHKHPSFVDLSGQDVEMWCSHEEGQDGEMREKWGVARQGGPKKEAPEVKSLDAKKFRDLNNLFGKHLKELAPKTNGVDFNKRLKPVPAVAGDNATFDGDVPF